MTDDICTASATNLARMIRERDASSIEVVDAHLARIGDVNPKLNAVVRIAPDARDRTRDADAALARGDAAGPLHGVPFTAKDWLEAKGLICAAGVAERSQFVPKRDATVVGRMRAAWMTTTSSCVPPPPTWRRSIVRSRAATTSICCPTASLATP